MSHEDEKVFMSPARHEFLTFFSVPQWCPNAEIFRCLSAQPLCVNARARVRLVSGACTSRISSARFVRSARFSDLIGGYVHA